MSKGEMSPIDIVEWAYEESSYLLKGLDLRWSHVQGVAKKAKEVSSILEENEKNILIATAYLHDIGYSKLINKTGFHPLDGAMYLNSKGQKRLASIVAYHSEAQFEAKLRGLDTEISNFKKEKSILSYALTYCDMTTNSKGFNVTFEDRLKDIFDRYDETTIINKAVHQAIPLLKLSFRNVEKLINENRMK